MIFRLDGAGPLSVQVYRALRAGILDGRIGRGKRLPATRDLAVSLGVSRNTVLVAFDQLLGEGYATARQGSGTYAAAELPDDLSSVRESDSSRTTPAEPRARLSRFGDFARKTGLRGLRDAALPYDFRYGRPGFTDFPHELWCRLLATRARRASARHLDYGPPQGWRPLRQAIAEYLGRARGVCSSPATPSSSRSLITRERGVVYVTPSHQFPSGVVMSLARRLALLAFAAERRAFVFEDDYEVVGEDRIDAHPARVTAWTRDSGRTR